MPLRQSPQFKPIALKMFEVPQPGIGGLNLNDLEYEQEVNQSPYMLNMMYRNGTFSKRYGQALYDKYEGQVYASFYYNEKLLVHSGTNLYSIDPKTGTQETISSTLPQVKGLFIPLAQTLQYYCDGTIYQYKYDNTSTPPGWVWGEIEYYIPDVFVNCKPAGGDTEYDRLDDLNLLSNKFNCIYNGEASVKDYKPPKDAEEFIDWDGAVACKVNDEVTIDFTVDKVNKKITFTNAPGVGDLNVEITFTLQEGNLKEDKTRLLNSKYWCNYGSNGSSHLFLGGGGDSKIFYSESYDPAYFPENNWIIIGSTEQDVTGFGLQYNVLIVLKPREIYSIYSYTRTASMVSNEDDIGTEGFTTTMVNASVGCDAPNTIQLINNQLTWFNSIEGICTLASTNITDERNVRVISRNINKTNNMGVKGILDYTEDINSLSSVDYDNKYFLVFPESGMCFAWDYVISPFTITSSKVTDPRTLDWFLFDKIYAKEFVKVGKDLLYVSSHEDFEGKLVQLNDSFEDLDFNGDDKPDGINAHYMTPFYQFDAVEYLKNVKNLYVQTRGDTASVIDIYYYTENNPTNRGNKEQEPIVIGGKIWNKFDWNTFQWLVVNWANTFMRNCGLKKIQMASFFFENKDKYEDGELVDSVAGRDMSISHISLSYSIVKPIK